MTKESKTPAIRFLEQQKVAFEVLLYEYQEKGGTQRSSQALGWDEERILKSLVFEDENKKPLMVLMLGHLKVSTKKLARDTGRKSIQPCKPEVAERHTGYQVGGTSPFGIKKQMPIYLERSALDHDRVLINGGKRGQLVVLDPGEIVRTLDPVLVEVGLDKSETT
ncbi:MAG: aminoacyl-tRNA deacylase [Acidobacteria bacterium]|nr:aminoacyl-tRNA deacylase [Acidobacteriota bacterium]MCB9397600.1 aminoacyl-tRNA deacylase [Acidobacteriota bacterium]